MPDLTRREILGAAAAAGLLGLPADGAAPKPAAGEELPTFRYPMEQQKGKVTEGGSGKEATIKQLPISKGIAGVSMRLKPGGLRELHWHANAAEWAFVVKGRVRTTVIGPDGAAETNDFDPGDVWYFPRGHGHALQGLGPDESHFILVFDNGGFSEYGTFSITDWLAQTPPHVLSQTLGLPESAFEKFPREELYIVQGRVPPEKMETLRQPGLRTPAQTHRYPLMAQEPRGRFPGGEEWLVSASEFPVSTTITGVILDLEPGALREPHWHPHANEWQYLHLRQGAGRPFRLARPIADRGIRDGRRRLHPAGVGPLHREHRRFAVPHFDRVRQRRVPGNQPVALAGDEPNAPGRRQLQDRRRDGGEVPGPPGVHHAEGRGAITG